MPKKMQFLKTKLKGDAEKLIQHLRISSENYQASWDILNHRYDNTNLIFNSHINILMNLSTIQQQSAAAIKKIHDTTNECLNAIKNLGVDISTWDPLIVNIITHKLDADTHNDYIESLNNPRDLASLQELMEFLESKFTSLESSRRKHEATKSYPQHGSSNSNIKRAHFYKSFTSNQNHSTFNNSYNSSNKESSSSTQKCPVCNKDNAIFYCNTFLEYQPEIKQKTIHKLSLCKNCLYNHRGKECYSTKRCRQCQGDHNTLLHDTFNKLSNTSLSSTKPNTYSKESNQHKNSTHVLQEDSGEILLATTQIKVQAADGSVYTLRALVDQGSQTSLISENAAQILGLPRKRCKGVIFGVGARENNCKGVIRIKISSIWSDYTFDTDVFIMKNLVNNLPNKSFSKPSWPHIENIQLADPDFYISRSVDLLLGADIYSSIILGGIIKENEHLPVAQQTRLGWILCGNVKSYQCNVVMINVEDMHRFWSIEDVADNVDLSAEDYQCVQLYNSTTTRQSDGRYVVRLPLHQDVDEKLGSSKQKAAAQFHQLERKFQKQENIAKDYKLFIKEYIDLGHMHCTSSNKTPSYYLPHHCVQRADSTTTSLRVVFNASESSSTGYSLNDLMYRGPNLQQDLLSLVLQWRQYQYAFTADIEKMFRQILIHHDDQHYQQIVWRDCPNQPLRDYQLASVTYGTKAAPFLAMMTLKRLASDEGHRFPAAAKVLENQFYMDDLLSGSHSIKSAKQLQADLIQLLKSGGFNLRKWSSNEPGLLEEVSTTQNKRDTLDFKHQESSKTLGLTWKAKEDNFSFQCKMSKQLSSKLTKRALLSEISKIFDPLGWLAPVVVQLKLLFQNVWVADLKWDDTVPDNINREWVKIRSEINGINKIEIPRWIGSGESDRIQLHGFCDASTKAYACVVYARIEKQDKASVTLLAAKTKLVPVNKMSKSTEEVSLPRLELSGAHLLSKLINKITQSLNNNNIRLYGWCDSTAVLGWLNGEPSRWKPFVANRVKKITENMTSDCWRYVKSNENPADCASRGLSTEQLIHHPLWFKGPIWLSSFNEHSEKHKAKFVTNLEIKKSNVITQKCASEASIIEQLISSHSSFTRLTRVLAWILRAIARHRIKQSFLSVEELRISKHKIVKHIQQTQFSEDIKELQNNSKVGSKSKILCLNPFLDKDGLLRVGGRLTNSNLNYDMKHPFIIPHSSHLSNLLIDHAHKSTFHGGARLTLSWLRQQYWVIGGNREVKKRLQQCVLCKRHNPIKQHQLMGDLPASRTNPTRPFYHTGVDFTGYVDVKSSKGRGIKTSKGYVAVFICMVTKAVHLELVSDLSSSAFLAALRRLSARRGTPRHLYSDNGTNFVGASKILAREYLNLKSILTEEFYTEISEMQIEWHFNAPSWPSAGGLWEAAVKSLKYHLRRVVGDQKLTYEELTTLLSQLEACINSRPLCALTEDPNDINYLTPSHFLASGPILTITETEKDERTRWQLVQKIFESIWKRWRTEYLCQISARSKWRQPQANIRLDDIVVIHDANLPAGKWALGRVVDLHPGKDGYIRVVSVKTKNGIIKRPIIKLSVLPTSMEESN